MKNIFSSLFSQSYDDFQLQVYGKKKIVVKECTPEFDELLKQWRKEAWEQTTETLPKFIESLMNDYKHDYGTVCHAIAIISNAAAHAADHEPQGGITGFQAGAIMFEFMKTWNYTNNKTGFKVVNFDDFLYPQHGDKFEKTISKHTWEALQKQARINLEESNIKLEEYIERLEQYTLDILEFILRYPDYQANKEHYDRLSFGTGDEWDAYYAKRDSGFEFAPQKPYSGVPCKSVRDHWKSIVSGVIPFGFVIKD